MGIRRKVTTILATLSIGIALSIAGPSAWTPSAVAASCSPASETFSVGGVNYQVLVFTNSSSCDWSVPEGVTEVDALVIGGGGAGGGLGGGGAGEFVERTSLAVSGVISVAVGAGGPAVGGSDATARNGSSSTFGSITAAGGGGGGLGNGGSGAQGANGASGGGAARGDGSPGQTVDDGDANSFGSDGAEGWGFRDPTIGGAGGGAGAAPENAIASVAIALSYGEYYVATAPGNSPYPDGDAGVVSQGGSGRVSTIIPASIATALSVGDVSGEAVYFAGGGGGGCGITSGGSGCTNADLSGGTGGGGDGSGGAGANGTGGGGAGSSGIGGAGGSGGSGVVVVRYVLTDSGSIDSGANLGVQGIFLAVNEVLIGKPVSGAPVYYGADGVQPNSSYTLSLQPVVNSALARTVLARGAVNSRGHLDERAELQTLNPGTYKIVMTGTHPLGHLLVLTNYITVGANGNIVSVSAESQQPFLN